MDGLTEFPDIERDAPDLFEFLRELMPIEPRKRSVAARVIFGPGGSPVSQPIAKPGEF